MLNTLTFAGDSGNWQGQLRSVGQRHDRSERGDDDDHKPNPPMVIPPAHGPARASPPPPPLKIQPISPPWAFFSTTTAWAIRSTSTGTSFGPFDGQNPTVNAVLVKFTYFGDANLDGVVNGPTTSPSTTDSTPNKPAGPTAISTTTAVINGDDYTSDRQRRQRRDYGSCRRRWQTKSQSTPPRPRS